MRYIFVVLCCLRHFTSESSIAMQYIKTFQKVLIETLPVNGVKSESGDSVFSFELPNGFRELGDTLAACQLA
jgi:hypothetical protein